MWNFWRKRNEKKIEYRSCFDDYCVTIDGRLINTKTNEEVWPGLKGFHYLGEFDPLDIVPKIIPVKEDGDPPGIYRLAIWKEGKYKNSFWVSVWRKKFMLEYEPRSDYMIYKYFPLSDGFYEIRVPWNYKGYVTSFAGYPLKKFEKQSNAKIVKQLKKYSPFEDYEIIAMNMSPSAQEFILDCGLYVRIEGKNVRLGTISLEFASELRYFAENLTPPMDFSTWMDMEMTPEDIVEMLSF